MIELRLPNVAGATIELKAAHRVLTVYTPLAVEMGSPDSDEFYRLRTRLQLLVDPLLGGYDELRIVSLDPMELSERSIRVDAFGDPLM